MSARRVVGVDGGATRTRVVLADDAGRELARSEGGPGIIGEGYDDAVVDDVMRQIRDLADRADCKLPVDVLCAGFAGAAGRPSARQQVLEALLASGCARGVTVVSDSQVAFVDAFGSGPGILIIGGTGSIALGRAHEVPESSAAPEGLAGALVRVGGWGRLLGDEGSAFALGLAGLKAAVCGAEGRGPRSGLTERLFGEIEVADAQGAFEWSESATKGRIAALAPHVVSEADAGDPEASRLVDGTVAELVAHAVALRERLGAAAARLTVALVGGLVEPGGSLRDRVERALIEWDFVCLDRTVDPARGAVAWALRD